MATSSRTRFRFRQLPRKSVRRCGKFEHRQGTRHRAHLVKKSVGLGWPPAYFVHGRRSLARPIGGARNDGQQDRVLIVKSVISRLGVLPDRLLVEEPVRVMQKDPSVLILQSGPHAAHDGNRLALWPAVRHQPQPRQEGKSFVGREPDLDASPGGLGAEEREAAPMGACGRVKGAIRLKQALDLGAQALGRGRALAGADDANSGRTGRSTSRARARPRGRKPDSPR